MKKFLKIAFIIFSVCIFTCFEAYGKTVPLYKNSINTEGIGIIKLPQRFNIYESPGLKSKVIKEIVWGEESGAIVRDDTESGFIIFYPAQNQAFMTVIDDTESGGWYRVCYDQKNKLYGWVSPDKYTFYSWINFFSKYGKANGLYAFRDLDLTEKRLYAKPDLNSQILGSFERAKDIRVQIYRGNWALVRVYDYEGGLKIGWLKWRTDEGKFKFFPNVLY